HILYPQNIPDIDLATSTPQATRREKVKLDPLHKAIQEVGELESKSQAIPKELQERSDAAVATIENDPKFKALIGSLKELGVELDTTACNFTYDEQGDALIYIDDIHLEDADWQTENRRGFDEEKLTTAIMNIHDERIRERAENFLKR